VKGACEDERYHGSRMTWSIGLAGLLILIALAIAALIKSLFYG
jgi:hypothetical protein